MASVFLAAKLEEVPKRIRDVVNVFHHLQQRRLRQPWQHLDLSSEVRVFLFLEIYQWRSAGLLEAERRSSGHGAGAASCAWISSAL
jgi:hypothetical protein